MMRLPWPFAAIALTLIGVGAAVMLDSAPPPQPPMAKILRAPRHLDASPEQCAEIRAVVIVPAPPRADQPDPRMWMERTVIDCGARTFTTELAIEEGPDRLSENWRAVLRRQFNRATCADPDARRMIAAGWRYYLDVRPPGARRERIEAACQELPDREG